MRSAGFYMFAAAMMFTLFQTATSVEAARKVTCDTCPLSGIDFKASTPFHAASQTSGCKVQKGTESLPMQDPSCTPGAVNPTVTLAVLQGGKFRTGCVRNCLTSESAKEVVYTRYGVTKDRATCELDHLVPLELGGADSLDNIWPQCGPSNAKGLKIFFKEKDLVEDYLTTIVKAGTMQLRDAQEGIATDWTKFKDQAVKFCAANKCGSEQ